MLYIIFFFAVFTIYTILAAALIDNSVKKLNALNEDWFKLGMPYMCKDINGNFINKK